MSRNHLRLVSPTGDSPRRPVCDRRPFPARCAQCPAMAWPPAGWSEIALLEFLEDAKSCPFDDQTSVTHQQHQEEVRRGP